MTSIFSRVLWDLHSIVYDFKTSAVVHKDLQEDIINELDFKGGELLLDAGIGTGALEIALLRRGISDIKVVGVDISTNMLKRAEKRLNHKFKDLELKRLNLNSPLPFPVNHFDAIACCNTFYTLYNHLAALKEFYRILKPHGKIVLTTPHERFKGTELMKYHYKKSEKLHHYLKAASESLLSIFLILPFELLITIAEKKGEYKHLDEESMGKLFLQAGFNSHKIKLAYAEQNWLVKAGK